MSSAAAAFLLEYRATGDKEGKKREKGTRGTRERERERVEKKGVRTSDDFFGKREKINEKKKEQ